MTKTEKSHIIGRSGCGKTFLMLSLLKDTNPDDVYIICEKDNQYPSKYQNQSSEILPSEDYANRTIVFDDMLDDMYSIKNVSGLEIVAIPQTTAS